MPSARIGDIDLHYRMAGSGEPLMLLHGLGSSGADWEHQLPVLAAHFTVIAPDLRGSGASSKPPGPYTIAQHTADVLGLADHLGIRSCHMLGFSMGGAVAFQIGVDAPERLASLIVVNSHPSYAVDHWRKYLYVITRIGMARLVGPRRLARYVAKRLFPEPHQEYLRRKMLERHGDNDVRAYLDALHGLRGWSVADRVGEIDVPTLVIAAEHDYTPVEEKRAYAARMPDARLEIVRDSRHATHYDQPERFNKLVVEFLLELRARTLKERYRSRLLELFRPRRRLRDVAADPRPAAD